MSAYRRLLSQNALTQSMSRKGNCLDNAAMESFFGTLKTEFYYANEFRDLDDLEKSLKEYIHYYNHERSKLKFKGAQSRRLSSLLRSSIAINLPTFWVRSICTMIPTISTNAAACTTAASRMISIGK